jgi:hypothetical protein
MKDTLAFIIDVEEAQVFRSLLKLLKLLGHLPSETLLEDPPKY